MLEVKTQENSGQINPDKLKGYVRQLGRLCREFVSSLSEDKIESLGWFVSSSESNIFFRNSRFENGLAERMGQRTNLGENVQFSVDTENGEVKRMILWIRIKESEIKLSFLNMQQAPMLDATLQNRQRQTRFSQSALGARIQDADGQVPACTDEEFVKIMSGVSRKTAQTFKVLQALT